MDEDSSTEQKICQVCRDVLGYILGFRLHLNESREGFCRRGRGRSFDVDGPKTKKARNQQWRGIQAESIRSSAESTEGCVKLKTDTEIVRSSAHDTFPAIDDRIQGRLFQSIPLNQGWFYQVKGEYTECYIQRREIDTENKFQMKVCRA